MFLVERNSQKEVSIKKLAIAGSLLSDFYEKDSLKARKSELYHVKILLK